jgi:ribonuclease BN (tRNA processing enzyme)
METYAYRFTEKTTGSTFVFSGDTAYVDRLGKFAAGADLLVHDACVAPPVDDLPSDDQVGRLYEASDTAELLAMLGETHCTPDEAAMVATAAGADTLVLTHLLPYRDTDAMYDAATAIFDGEVFVAEDGLSIEI